MPKIGLNDIFTGVIVVILVITFFRGIPTRADIQSIEIKIEKLTERIDRHLEYHGHIDK